MFRWHTRSGEIAEYNDRCKRLCVNPRDRDNTLNIFTKDKLALVLIGIFVLVLSRWSIAAYASEKPPFDVDWACNLIMESLVQGQHKENLPQEIEVVNPEAVSIETEDGGMIIDFGKEEDTETSEFDSNLAEFIEDSELDKLANDLLSSFESDKQSRSEWAKSYVKGLDLLGMKIEERQQPWAGSSGVFHPVLTESIVRFQAQAMGEIFPAQGPVRTKTVGKISREKTEQAKRVENEMNYLLTEEMTEYRDETEQMLFKLPLAGSAFKKSLIFNFNNVI